MAHKTFISYKYSEAQDLRDAIIDAIIKVRLLNHQI